MAEIVIDVSVQTGNSADQLNKVAKAAQGLAQTAEPFKSLRTQVKEAKVALDQALERFGPFSKEAASAGKELGKLNDRLGDIQSFSAAFDTDAKFRALGGALQGVVGGFSALTAAQGIFGAESKATEEALKKVQATLALQQGLDAVLKSVDSFKALGAQILSSGVATKIFGVATSATTGIMKLFGVAVNTTSTAFKVLRGAIIATGIGALVVALGFIIEKVSDFTSGTKEQEKAEKALNDEIERSNKLLDENLGIVDYAAKARVLNARIAGKSAKEINDIENQSSQERVKVLRDALEQARNLTDKAYKVSEEKGKEARKNELDVQKQYFKALEDADLKNLEQQAKTAEEGRKKSKDALDKRQADAKAAADALKAVFTNLEKELKGLKYDQNLGANNVQEQVDKIKETIKKLVVEFGLAANDPRIQALQQRILEIRGTEIRAKVVVENANSLEALNDQLKDLQEKRQKVTSTFELIGIDKAIADLQAKITQKESGFTVKLPVGFKSQAAQVRQALDGPKKEVEQFTLSLADTFGGLGDAIGAAIAAGGDPFKAAAQTIVSSLGGLLVDFGKQIIAASTLFQLAKKSIFKGPAGIAAGIALVALGTIIKNSINKKASKGFAEGGFVSGPGTNTSDSIPAMLSNNEFVVRAKSVKKYGVGFLNAINSGIYKFAQGGLVGLNNSIPTVPGFGLSNLDVQAQPAPYIATTKISGQDLRIVLNRADQRFINNG